MQRRTSGFGVATCALAALAVGAFAGCGSSGGSSDAPIEARIERERADAASSARQAQRVEDLEQQVKRLERSRRGRTTTVVQRATASAASAVPVASAAGEESSGRTFHVPSGNVSCRVTATSAACSVPAISTTFSFSDGSPGRQSGGLALGRSAGQEVTWGSAVSVGSVTCSVPLQSEPRGIACSDSSSGHGFEASKISARQRTF